MERFVPDEDRLGTFQGAFVFALTVLSITAGLHTAAANVCRRRQGTDSNSRSAVAHPGLGE
jgi:hypothetical protein